jgi:hypothetical protein
LDRLLNVPLDDVAFNNSALHRGSDVFAHDHAALNSRRKVALLVVLDHVA